MIRYLLLFLLIPSLCLADVDTMEGTAITAASNVEKTTANIDDIEGLVVAAASSYQQTETFDGSNTCYSGGASNCDNTNYFHSNTGDPNFTDTTPAMEGTNHLTLDAADYTHWDIQNAQTTNYITYRFEASEAPESNAEHIAGYDSGNDVLWYCSIRGDTNDQLYCYLDGDIFDTPDAYVDNAIAADTDYWLKFKHVSGSSCSLEAWVSTDGTTWSGSSSVSTTCTDTDQLADIRVRMSDSASGQEWNIDMIKADDEDITDATNDL